MSLGVIQMGVQALLSIASIQSLIISSKCATLMSRDDIELGLSGDNECCLAMADSIDSNMATQSVCNGLYMYYNRSYCEVVINSTERDTAMCTDWRLQMRMMQKNSNPFLFYEANCTVSKRGLIVTATINREFLSFPIPGDRIDVKYVPSIRILPDSSTCRLYWTTKKRVESLWKITRNQFSLFDEAIRCAQNTSLNDWISHNTEERIQPVSPSRYVMAFWIHVAVVASASSAIFFCVRFGSKHCEKTDKTIDSADENGDAVPRV